VDLAPGPLTLDYAPADGATVTINPPPFTWVPSDAAVQYRLEVSADSSFPENASICRVTEITTAALTETLAPGTWYWRYRVSGKNGQTALSRSRRFSVPPACPTFVFPDLAAAIAQVPRTHPRLFFPAAEWPALRQTIRDRRGSDAQALLRDAMKAVGQTLVPEPPYVQGKGPERGRNYQAVFRATRPPMDAMERCALAYLITGDRRPGDEAKRRLLHFFGWDPEGSTAYRHNDEPAMWVMMRGVRAYDWTRDLFSADERTLVEAAMRVRARQFYEHLRARRRFHTSPYESHAARTLGFLGEVSLAFIHEWPEARDYLDYVLTLFWNVYPAWGKADGGWHEGPSYWAYYMEFALHFVVSLRQLTGIDLLRKPFFRNTPYYKLYTNPPYARTSAFGDGEHQPPGRGMGQLMYWFGTLLDNPHFIWYARELEAGPGRGCLGFLLGGGDVEGRPPSDLPPCRYFPGVGLVSMHAALGDPAADIHLLFHSDPYGSISHAHADQNAFTLEAFGEALAIASGYYPWYGSDHHRNWQWHSRSSNTITFDDGQGQRPRDPSAGGRITAFRDTEHFAYVCGDATAAYGTELSRAERHILWAKPGLFLVYDELESRTPRRFEWRLHSLEAMALAHDSGRLTVSRGQARLQVQFLTPDRLELTQTDDSGWPPEDGSPPQWHLVATTARPLASCRFLVALMPFREGGMEQLPSVAASVSPGAITVSLSHADERLDATFRETGAPRGTRVSGSRLRGGRTVADFTSDGAAVGP
jgi:hypothetical protein